MKTQPASSVAASLLVFSYTCQPCMHTCMKSECHCKPSQTQGPASKLRQCTSHASLCVSLSAAAAARVISCVPCSHPPSL